MRKRRMARHRRKKGFRDFFSTRLLTVILSILTSALMLCGIAIYAEVQSGGPREQAEELASNVEAAEPISLAPEPQAESQAEPEEAASAESGEQPESAKTVIVPDIIVHTPEPAEESTQEPTEEPAPEPTEEPTPEPTAESTGDPSQAATATPIPTIQPTENPTAAPTTEPTAGSTYAPSAYTISITPPSGWHRDTAKVALRVVDMNGTDWQSIRVRINGDGAWMDVTDQFASAEVADIEISEDCTVYVAVISLSGNAHTANKYIECFDREIPVVRAAIDGETLRAEGKDNLSGVAAIIVCGHRFTDLEDDVLRIRLEDYADNYEQVSIQAEDNVGNLSKIKTLKNPYYDPNLPTPTPQPSCVPTVKPTAAPSPTATPKPTGSSGGSSTRTPKPTATPWPVTSSDGTSATPTPNTFTTATPNPSASVGPTISPIPAATYCLCDSPCACATTACRCETVCLCGYTQQQLLAIEPGTGFSSTGNAVARDLLYDKHSNKQFIHMQTRDGASFYVVIDYDKPLDEDGESYETYFLNTVDARDLFDLVEEEDLPAQYQATPTPMPTDVPMPTPEPTEVPPEATPEPEPEPVPESGGMGGMMGIVLLALAGGGCALWYFKFKKPKGQAGKRNNYEDYDFDDEDDEEYEDEDADGDDA